MDDTPASFDVVVVGGGPAGLATAIAVAQTGASTALIARRAPYADNRTTALLGDSIDLLTQLEVWPRCKDQAAGLHTIRLVSSVAPPNWTTTFVDKRLTIERHSATSCLISVSTAGL